MDQAAVFTPQAQPPSQLLQYPGLQQAQVLPHPVVQLHENGDGQVFPMPAPLHVAWGTKEASSWHGYGLCMQ